MSDLATMPGPPPSAASLGIVVRRAPVPPVLPVRVRRRWLRWIVVGLGVVVLALLALAAVRVESAARAGVRGQQGLVDAVALLTPSGGVSTIDAARLDQARARLSDAQREFAAMRRDLDGAGPAYAVAERLPFVRVQVRGVRAVNGAGSDLSDAALQLTSAAGLFLQPENKRTSLASGQAMTDLRELSRTTTAAADAIDAAVERLATLDGYRLVGPLASARVTLAAKLPPLQKRATSSRDALSAFVAFAGGDGPRRYLVLSQNPDEVRPTGGYMGSYGLIDAVDGRLSVPRYGDTNAWVGAHPQAVVPAPAAGSAVFRIAGSAQTLANTNASPDWPAAARLASSLWAAGGEQPVDGVVSFTPQFLARIVGVLGPITVPSYGDTITGANLVERTDYWAHHAPERAVAGRGKEFLSALAPLVTKQLVNAPSSAWPSLAAAVGDGFATQEAMIWSSDAHVQSVITAHRWDYTLPEVAGDFHADAEFAFGSKNGSGLQRTFDHTVVVRRDGSARVTTVMMLRNTDPPDPIANPSSNAYLTPYGPVGAVLDASSDRPDWDQEPALNGHPTAGWQRAAAPGATTSLKVVWNVSELLTSRAGGWGYSLVWMPTASHRGDVVRLRVVLPAGMHWAGAAPPATFQPDRVFRGRWAITS